MKKKIVFIFILILIYKLDFLFFKLKVCNNSGYNMYVNIKYEENDYLDLLIKKLIGNYLFDKGKIISLGEIKKNTCTSYFFTDRFNKYFIVEGIIQENNKLRFCNNTFIDYPKKVEKLGYGKYLINIDKIVFYDEGCNLFYNFKKHKY